MMEGSSLVDGGTFERLGEVEKFLPNVPCTLDQGAAARRKRS